MQLHEAAEVIVANSPQTATEKLKEGWKLLAVTTAGKDGLLHPCFVLGRPAEQPEKAAGYIPTVGAVQMDVRDR